MSHNILTPSVLFIHGLESGVKGSKALYLQRHFKSVKCPVLHTGGLNWNRNSFLVSYIVNIPALLSGHYYETVGRYILSSCMNILKDFAPTDLVVGSSMGGAISLESFRRGLFPNSRLLLLAPALKRVLVGPTPNAQSDQMMSKWYQSFNDQMASYDIQPRIVVVHGALDDIISIEDSRELCAAIGAKLIEVEEGDHSLNDFLLDGVSKKTGRPQQNQLKHIILQEFQDITS